MSSSLLRVRRLLSRVEYRPGWTVEAFPTPVGGRVWVLIDAVVLDSEKYDPTMSVDWNYTVGRTTRVGVRAVVPNFSLQEEFYDWLGKRLIRCERHESREFFQVDGVPWNSPHKVPQPKHDYTVRKRGGSWGVWRHDNTLMGVGDTWEVAYAAAWECVIDDDDHKPETAMVNG